MRWMPTCSLGLTLVSVVFKAHFLPEAIESVWLPSPNARTRRGSLLPRNVLKRYVLSSWLAFVRQRSILWSSCLRFLSSWLPDAGRPALCCRMKRQKVKGTGHKQPADANTEPNFYSFPHVSSADSSDEPVPQPDLLRQDQADEAEKKADAPVDATGSASSVALAPSVVPTPLAGAAVAMSPGIASIHGAAHLLRRIASDERAAPFASLPPAAATAAATASTTPVVPMSPPSTALWGSGLDSFGQTSPRGAYFLRQSAAPNDDLAQSPSTAPRSPTDHGFRC